MFHRRVFFLTGGHHKMWKSVFSYSSIPCLYKNDFTNNFSKFNLFPSVFYYYLFFFLLFKPNIVICTNIWCLPGDGSNKEYSSQCRRYKKTQVWSLGVEHPLQEGTAAYSSILAWPILWTVETVGLESVGLQRVGHNWIDLECMHAPIFNHLIFCLLARVGKKKMGSQNGGWKKI